MAITVSAFLTLALSEIRVVRGGDVPQAASMQLALDLFNELLEALCGTPRALFSVSFTTFTTVPSLQPHTIGTATTGPAATFAMTRRPIRLLSANLVLQTNINRPIWIRDRKWWSEQRAPAITGALSTDLYYEADWPLGQIWLWPIITQALGIQLQTQNELAAVTQADTLDLPQGYQQALRLTLAEVAAPHFGQVFSPDQKELARNARATVWANNDQIPNLVTRDAGMPRQRGGGAFDYRTGGMIR